MPERIANLSIGAGGTILATALPSLPAQIAGYATAAWMLWQLGCGIYDRFYRRK